MIILSIENNKIKFELTMTDIMINNSEFMSLLMCKGWTKQIIQIMQPDATEETLEYDSLKTFMGPGFLSQLDPAQRKVHENTFVKEVEIYK